MLRVEPVLRPAHDAIIRRDLNNRLYKLVPDIRDETLHAVDKTWALERRSFAEINEDKTIREIATRISNRAFVRVLCEYLLSASCQVSCRDTIYIPNATIYVSSILVSALTLELFHCCLRSFVAQSITLEQYGVPDSFAQDVRMTCFVSSFG